MIIFGTRLFGKVDEVPGLFHVATRFAHIDYVPLVPTGTFVVFSEEGSGFRGASIGMSGKSVIVAWARAACVIAGIAGLVMLFIAFTSSRADHGLLLAAMVLAGSGVGGYAASKMIPAITHASYERACEIAAAAGISEEGMLLIDVAFERLSPEELERELAQIKATKPGAKATGAKPTKAPGAPSKKAAEESDLEEVESDEAVE
jgi:hypothetical protein